MTHFKNKIEAGNNSIPEAPQYISVLCFVFLKKNLSGREMARDAHGKKKMLYISLLGGTVCTASQVPCFATFHQREMVAGVPPTAMRCLIDPPSPPPSLFAPHYRRPGDKVLLC